MEIKSATKDRNNWWVYTDDGYMRRVRHSIERASQSPISPEEELMCALLEKLYPQQPIE